MIYLTNLGRFTNGAKGWSGESRSVKIQINIVKCFTSHIKCITIHLLTKEMVPKQKQGE